MAKKGWYWSRYWKMFNKEKKEHPKFKPKQIHQIVKDHFKKGER